MTTLYPAAKAPGDSYVATFCGTEHRAEWMGWCESTGRDPWTPITTDDPRTHDEHGRPTMLVRCLWCMEKVA